MTETHQAPTPTAEPDLRFHQEMADGPSEFEQQFNNRKIVEARGGAIEVVDLKPESLDPKATPIMIAGGWTEGPDAFKYTMKELYERGNRVISIDHPTRGDTVEKVKDYPEAELRKAMNYHDALENMGVEKADVIAHSAGAGNAMLWATLYPGQVRNVVLTNPDGLIGKDSFLRLFLRFQPKLARSIATSVVNRPAGRALVHGTKNIVGRPGKVKRALAEVVAISKADITKAIDNLREKGHKVGVLVSNTDPVFKTERVQRQLITEAGETDEGRMYPEEMRTDAFAMNARKPAGHDELIVHPEMGAAAAEQMLRSFESPRHPSLLKEVQPYFTKSEKLSAAIMSRWSNSKLREHFVTGEKARRNRVIAAAVGAVAVAGGLYAAYKFGFDSRPSGGNKVTETGMDQVGTPMPSSRTGTSIVENAPQVTPPKSANTLVDTTNQLGANTDVSQNIGLPEGYLRKSPGGYEVTAMFGHDTDSVWKAGEHALADRLGRQPSVTQIDALKDILGEHFLDVGDKVNITDSQIERALHVAAH